MRNIAFKIAFCYVAAGLLCITLSDKILLFLAAVPILHPLLTFLNRVSGFTYFLLTGAILLIALFFANRHLLPEDIDTVVDNQGLQNKHVAFRRMEDIIANISNMVLIADNETKIVWTNQALEDFVGFKLNELAEKPVAYFLNRIHADNVSAEQVNDRLKKAEVFSMDLSVFTDKDSPSWIHGDFTPLFDAKGQSTGYILFFTDISGIKKKEEFLLRQNEVLREIAWIESHEVRRPLASILGLIELLQACSSDEEKQEVFEMILSSGGELDVMIRKINERIIEVML
ncbi:MAG: PAS domain S-box protein [Mucilaginibacter sp.]|uniref:PAS domain S-box protein n=1 Tax=Mucilaginibacter sp. TaxID=1882438 RepID=UPI0032656194